MKIIDHGEWNLYKPTRRIMDAPSRTLFAKRKSDGKDWYEYVASNPFKKDTIKLNCRFQVINIKLEKGWVVMVCSRDPTTLFPDGSIILELGNSQEDLEGKIYNPETKTFSDKRVFE